MWTEPSHFEADVIHGLNSAVELHRSQSKGIFDCRQLNSDLIKGQLLLMSIAIKKDDVFESFCSKAMRSTGCGLVWCSVE